MRIKETLSQIEIDVLREISFYFKEGVHKLGIKNIKIKRNKIGILLNRPGIFIGKHGKDIDNLKEIIKQNTTIKKPDIQLFESNIDKHLSIYEILELKMEEI